ncbi:MAG: family 16 glycoside hydrolase [Limisphaerales bacterium]
MSRWFVILVAAVASTIWARAAERLFDFSQLPPGKPPEGFVSVLTGVGQSGEWKVVLADAPTAFKPLTPKAPTGAKTGVLAQLSTDPTDERFPALIFADEVFGDFTFTTKFKCVAGKVEQMAGVAFRYQDPKNYYVIRASGLGNNVRFYKFVHGDRSDPLGPEIPIAPGVWHELTVECKGNQIRCLLDGKEAIPALTDNSFGYGKVGFWTKSDSVSHFADARITYTPRETLAKALVREALAKKTSVTDVVIYMVKSTGQELRVIASHNEKYLGILGGEVEKNVIAKDVMYWGEDKSRDLVLVTLPLHDRNGDVVAGVRVEMKPFLGQTEQNAILRAMPFIKRMEQRFKEAKDLIE